MLRIFVSVLTAVALTGTAAAGPITDFFNYEAPRPPVAGNCAAIAATVGAQSTWYGDFAGDRYDRYTDKYQPFSARGCFTSEYECRVWHQVAISYLDGGKIIFARCRRGAPA
jgi:hypothetical protein